MKILNIALCKGRHNIPEATDGAIFGNTLDPLDIGDMAETVARKLDGVDKINLYVTGLTVALVEVIKYCYHEGVFCTLLHYDRESREYYPQDVL